MSSKHRDAETAMRADAKAFKEYATARAAEFRNLPVLDHSLDEDARVRYIERAHSIDPRSARNLEILLAHIRYIPLKELLDQLDAMVRLLNASGTGKDRVLLLQEWHKSDAWISTVVAAGLDFEFLDARSCGGSNGLSSLLPDTRERYEVLLFDDCMYTGTQMQARVSGMRSLGFKNTFACVPFVHSRLSVPYSHPALVELVLANKKGLFLASDAAVGMTTPIILRANQYSRQALTYLQTRMADDLSLPAWLFQGSNPFDPYTDQAAAYDARYRALEDTNLVRNCTHATSTCPPRAYMPLLRKMTDKTMCPLTEGPSAGGRPSSRPRRPRNSRRFLTPSRSRSHSAGR